MNFADLLLAALLLGAFGSSCYLLRQFFLSWKPAYYHANLANPLPLPWTVFLLYLAGFIYCYWKAHEWVILYSLGSVILILLFFHSSKSVFKNLQLSDFLIYLRTGLFTYLKVFFVVCVLLHKQQNGSYIRLYFLSAVFACLLLRHDSPFVFWNLKSRDFLCYLQKGLKTYLTFFIPFSLLTAACTYVFTALGFKDINQPAVELLMQSKGFWPIFGFLLFACVVAPVWEEITFRGFLYPFLKAKAGKTTALILSSLLFSAMHMHAPSFIPLAFLGALLALLYERTGSLGYNIMLHSFFNFSTCLFLLLLKYGSNPQLWKSM